MNVYILIWLTWLGILTNVVMTWHEWVNRVSKGLSLSRVIIPNRNLNGLKLHGRLIRDGVVMTVLRWWCCDDGVVMTYLGNNMSAFIFEAEHGSQFWKMSLSRAYLGGQLAPTPKDIPQPSRGSAFREKFPSVYVVEGVWRLLTDMLFNRRWCCRLLIFTVKGFTNDLSIFIYKWTAGSVAQL